MASSRKALHGLFFQEAIDYYPAICRHLSLLQSDQGTTHSIQELHRLFHNIKGAASQVYLDYLSKTACIAELITEASIDSQEPPSQTILRFLADTSSAIQSYCLNGEQDSQNEKQLYAKTLESARKIEEITQSGSWIKISSQLLLDENPPEKSTTSLTQNSVNAMNQDTIQSITNLLAQLTELHADRDQRSINTKVIPQIQKMIGILKQSFSHADFAEHLRFLNEFEDVLSKISTTNDSLGGVIPQFIGDFLQCLDLFFTPPYTISADSVDRVVTKMNRLTLLLDGVQPEDKSEPPFQDTEEQFDTLFADEPGLLFTETEEADSFADNNDPLADSGPDLFDDPTGSDLIFNDGADAGDLLDDNAFINDSLFADEPPLIHLDDEQDDNLADDLSLEEIFQAECEEHLVTINQALRVLEKDGLQQQAISPSLRGALKEMRRAVHTLKGAAAMTGVDKLSSFAHQLEELLDYLFEEASSLTPEAVSLIADAINTIEKISRHPESCQDQETGQIKDQLRAFISSPSTGPESDQTPVTDTKQETGFGENLDSSADTFDSPIASDTAALFDESADSDFIADDPAGGSELFDSDAFINDTLFADEQTLPPQDEDNAELQEIFQAECEEHLITINQALQVLEKDGLQDQAINPFLREALKEMRRAVHTLKGAAAMTGFDKLSSFTHQFEDLLDHLFEKASNLAPEAVSLMASAISTIEKISQHPDKGQEKEAVLIQGRILAFLATHSISDDFPEITPPDGDQDTAQTVQKAPALQESIDNIRIRTDYLDELVNLEGDLVVSRNSMSSLLDNLNQTVGELEAAKERLRNISGQLESGFETKALMGFSSGRPLSDQPLSAVDEAGNEDFDVMELDRYSELNLIIRSLGELSIDLISLHSSISNVSGELRGQVASQENTMRVMQDRFMRIRMTPMSSISRMFFQAVRDTSAKLGKKTRLLTEGEDVYLDRSVWTKISDPMMHLLRNAIDHGIETAEERTALHKPDIATVKISAQQRGSMVVLRISDDGGGIDVEKLRQKAVEAGLFAPDASPEETELLSCLFHTGFTTRETVSEISGRGVGLDVVHKNIQDLKGTILVQTKKGEGTTFELNIPISLSVNRAVIVMAGKNVYAIPLHNIREIRALGDGEKENDDGLFWHGEIVRKKYLAQLMQQQGSTEPTENGKGYLIIVPTQHGHSAVVVDNITGQQEIVVKSLGKQLKRVHGISGVTDFGDGRLIPILNLTELAGEAAAPVIRHEEHTEILDAERTLQILVVDDSISVRQSILRLMNSQNWVTKLAKDGVDALNQLEKFMPDIIISDIEMPRMNGYQFKEMLNSNELCKNIPVLMLTSRVSEKHQAKARELGVCEYVIKPYRDKDFINTIKKHAQPSAVEEIN